MKKAVLMSLSLCALSLSASEKKSGEKKSHLVRVTIYDEDAAYGKIEQDTLSSLASADAPDPREKQSDEAYSEQHEEMISFYMESYRSGLMPIDPSKLQQEALRRLEQRSESPSPPPLNTFPQPFVRENRICIKCAACNKWTVKKCYKCEGPCTPFVPRKK